MRIITVIISDKKDPEKRFAMVISTAKNKPLTAESFTEMIQKAAKEYKTKENIKDKKIHWKDLSKIPLYLTEKYGFKILRIDEKKNVLNVDNEIMF